MKFARRVFRIAGVYGLLALAPQYFLESKFGLDFPPAITHPEFYYGFIGVAVAWQVAFLIIANDPGRYRLLMIPAMIEKFSYGVAVLVLFGQGRLHGAILVTGLIDLVLGTLFAAAYQKTKA
jgi:hypothetical protein